MLFGKRIVVCIPYGRRRTVSILLNYLRRDRAIVDEVQFWMNTDPEQVEDVAWAEQQAEIFEGWIRCVPRPSDEALAPKQLNIGLFYAGTCDANTLYFRFDDDIVYVHPNYFPSMVAFRLRNPACLLVMGNIWNNAIIGWVHQQAGRIDQVHGVIDSPFCMDPVGWRSPTFAEHIHRLLLAAIEDGTVDDLLFDRYDLDGRRFSISNFVWTGEDARDWGGATGNRDEEIWLTEEWPERSRRINTVCGSGLVSHYSFFDQRPALDRTDILEHYRALSERALSAVYLDLLQGQSVANR